MAVVGLERSSRKVRLHLIFLLFNAGKWLNPRINSHLPDKAASGKILKSQDEKVEWIINDSILVSAFSHHISFIHPILD